MKDSNPRYLKSIFVIFILFVFISIQLNASDEEIEHDLSLISEWFAEQFSKLIAFNGTSEINIPAEVLPKGGIAVGLSGCGGITKTDTNAFKRLDMWVLPRGGDPLFTQLLMVTGLLHGKYGISEGYDLGIKLGGLSLRSTDQVLTISNNMVGAEVRMQMQKREKDGFDLIGTIAVNSINGYIQLSSTGSQTTDKVNIDESTTTYRRDGTSYSDIGANWNFTSIALRVIASKKFAFFVPFMGLQVDLNFGETKGEIGFSMEDITLTQTDDPGNVITSPDSELAGQESSTIPQVNLRILGGFELDFSTLKIWVSGESAGDNVSCMLGTRLQF